MSGIKAPVGSRQYKEGSAVAIGTDCHAYIEYWKGIGWALDTKPPFELHNPQWFDDKPPPGYGEISVGRDYSFFGIIAGVRGWVPRVPNGLERARLYSEGLKVAPVGGPPRGMPIDLSTELKIFINYEGSGVHSHSWATLPELEFWMYLHKKENAGQWYSWRKIRDRMRKLEKKGQKTRVVFWFDS